MTKVKYSPVTWFKCKLIMIALCRSEVFLKEILTNLANWSKNTQKKDVCDVANDVNYDVPSILSWSKSICNLETSMTRIRTLWKTTVFFREYFEWVWTSWLTPISPKGKPPRFSHSWLKISSSPWYPQLWLCGPYVAGAPYIKCQEGLPSEYSFRP